MLDYTSELWNNLTGARDAALVSGIAIVSATVVMLWLIDWGLKRTLAIVVPGMVGMFYFFTQLVLYFGPSRLEGRTILPGTTPTNPLAVIFTPWRFLVFGTIIFGLIFLTWRKLEGRQAVAVTILGVSLMLAGLGVLNIWSTRQEIFAGMS